MLLFDCGVGAGLAAAEQTSYGLIVCAQEEAGNRAPIMGNCLLLQLISLEMAWLQFGEQDVD